MDGHLGNRAQPLIELRDIRKTYGDSPKRNAQGLACAEVLRGVSLKIYPGEFVAIVGASGSGKSTLMHILGCLDKPSSGDYLFEGRDTLGLSADELAQLRRDGYGFVFQGYHLLATETARENVEVPALYAGQLREKRREQSTNLLQRLGMGAHLAHRPSQLSGGQQQRVAIARALMNGGRIILADEPTGALDSSSGAEVMALLHELAEAGHTIILVTHDRNIAAQARRIIEIHDGQIVADSGDAHTFDTPPSVLETESAAPSPQLNATRSRRVPADLGEMARSAWRVMQTNRFRTGLTLLGIVIGIASVIVMLAVGSGTQRQVMAQFETLGIQTMFVSVKAAGTRTQGAPLTLEDAKAIQSLPNVEAVAPYIEDRVVVRRGNVDHVTYGGGATPSFASVMNWKMAEGTMIDAQDDRRVEKVAMIGQTVKKALFADGSNPVGQNILVDQVPFQVIGVFAPKGASGGQDLDDRVTVPFSAAAARLFGRPNPSWIAVKIRDMGQSWETAEAIEALLAEQRHVWDVQVWNRIDAMQAQAAASQSMTRMLGLVAAVSLIVGGIGVMNVMLMSIRERMREIGVRMATGARQRDILYQFLTEAVLVTSIGGTAGVIIGTSVVVALEWLKVPVVQSLAACASAFGCAVLTGLVFGFMPARKAAKLNPVNALAAD